MTEPVELVEQVARALAAAALNMPPPTRELYWELYGDDLRRPAEAAIAAVRAYDEANQARADEPATERATPADGWEAF